MFENIIATNSSNNKKMILNYISFNRHKKIYIFLARSVQSPHTSLKYSSLYSRIFMLFYLAIFKRTISTSNCRFEHVTYQCCFLAWKCYLAPLYFAIPYLPIIFTQRSCKYYYSAFCTNFSFVRILRRHLSSLVLTDYILHSRHNTLSSSPTSLSVLPFTCLFYYNNNNYLS